MPINYVVTNIMERKNYDDESKKNILIIEDEVDITFTGLEDTGLLTVDTFNSRCVI